MSNDYFEYVVGSLTIEELNVLGILLDQNATAIFSTITNKEVCKKSDLSQSTYRKVIYGLICNKFVETVDTKKQRGLYLTDYGIMAIQKSLERMTA